MAKQSSLKFICRKRIKIFAICVVILSVIFIFYQLFYFKQLNEELYSLPTPYTLIRGIHPQQYNFYVPRESNKFVCIQSQQTIDFSQVNDDYCDCLDGSDEPGTNACQNGVFYCLFQDSTNKHRNFLPSSLVNDGVCDCCDGSDEWNADQLPFRLDDLLQRKLGRYQTPCVNICLKS